MICFRKQEERKNWSRYFNFLLFLFIFSDWRTDAAESWGLVGGTSGKCITEVKEKKRIRDSVGTVGWVFEMEKVKFCCYVFGF